MNEHQQIQQLMAIYRDLSPAEWAEVEAHGRRCAACAARLAAYRAMDQQLADGHDVRPAAALQPSFYAQLAEARRKERWPMIWRQLPELVMQTAVLALVIFVFISFWWALRQQSPQPAAVPEMPPPTATSEPTNSPPTATPRPTSTPPPTATSQPIWRIEQVRQFTNPQGSVNQLGLAANGAMLAVATGEQVQLWQTADWHSLGIWAMPALSDRLRTLNSLALSADATYLALGSLDYSGHAVVWQLPGRSYQTIFDEHGDSLTSLAFSPDGRYLASGTASNERVVRVWQLADGTLEQQFTVSSTINALAFTPDGAILAAGLAEGTVQLWPVAANEPVASLVIEDGWVTTVALTEELVGAGTLDGRLFLWPMEDTAAWQAVSLGAASIRTLIISADGNLAAAAASNGTIGLWQVEADGLHQLMMAETTKAAAQAVQLAFTAEGLLAVTGLPDGRVEVWQASQK